MKEHKPTEPWRREELWRWIHGELSPQRERELRRLAEDDPALEAERQRLERLWSGLELPPPAAVPVGFKGRVLAHWESRHRPQPLPRWVRAAGAAALAGGIFLGVGVGALPEEVAEDSAYVLEADGGLAEDYWQLLAELGEGDRG
ncbi:MAG: hypothetical protein AAF604_20845 [Acidobacteriota bacterium]